MRVYYDYQIMLGQKFGGISRYVYEVSKRLPSLGADVAMRAIHNRNYYFSERFGLNNSSSLSTIAAFHLINKAARFFDLKHEKFDIFHPTYYYANKPSGSKFIVTVHDMTHELYSLNPRVISAKRKIIPQADRIIAVSENTKRDILKFFPKIDPEIISVIYHGASMNLNVNKTEPIVPYDYVLFVGLRSLYKNFSRFTEAMKSLMALNRELHVLCVGGGSFTGEEASSFGEFSGRFHQLSLSDEDLARAYGGARCFVFPSEYEGFGIPLLEAFACSCPVVCSSSSSLPEVAGKAVQKPKNMTPPSALRQPPPLDRGGKILVPPVKGGCPEGTGGSYGGAAEYFDALDVDSMAGAIERVIENEELRKDLIEKGRERLKFFDWDKAARETFECYSIALKGAN